MNVKSVIAYRTEGTVTVLVSGVLSSSCDKAQIVDKYPGGNIVYITDPGKAQVFIESTTETDDCTEIQTPWLSIIQISDTIHKEVEIFVNGKSVETTLIFNSLNHF